MQDKIDELMQNTSKEHPICQKCHQKITDPAFIIVRGDIVNTTKSPNIFTCVEQIFNYAQCLVMHSVCWIETLREYGAELYDLTKRGEKDNVERGESGER